jgi:hypothetical protein
VENDSGKKVTMVILHVRVDDLAADQFLLETRTTEQTRAVFGLVAQLHALRASLREMLALLADPPPESLQLFSVGAVRRKELVDADTLSRHAERLATELARQGLEVPLPTAPADACASLAFGKRPLPCDETLLSALCGSNEKSKLTLTLVPSARVSARAPLTGACKLVDDTPEAEEVSLLSFLSRQSNGERGTYGGRGAREEATDFAGLDKGEDDEGLPRLTSEHINRLWASQKVCTALRSSGLQQALTRIDQSANPERELDLAMADEHFKRFVHEMLSEVGIREDAETA